MAESRVPVSIYSKFFFYFRSYCYYKQVVVFENCLLCNSYSLVFFKIMFLVTMVNITLDRVGVINFRPSLGLEMI